MSRLPWNNYAGHGQSHDEGGMEHLETDVMRFMAILAFCLVAIFALVQSMPLDSPPAAQAAAEDEAPQDIEPPVVVASETPLAEPEPLTQPAARAEPVRTFDPVSQDVLVMPTRPPRPTAPKPEAIALVMSKPEPIARTPVAPRQPESVAVAPRPAPPAMDVMAAPQAPTDAPDQQERGFSLRFASDEALHQLVSRDEVALYAMAQRRAWRVMMVNQRLSFRPAQTPAKFHEMAAETVPDNVVKTLRRLVTVAPETLRWGVTLPATTSRQLSEFLSAHDSGGLVIDASGGLRLEQG